MPTSDNSYRRIFDANWNRASEGIRVVEDYIRFACNHARLSSHLKQWRHDLASACQDVLTAQERLEARNTHGDVGTQLQTESESIRTDGKALVSANLERTQQAVRCLEEYSKVLGKPSTPLEQLRYRLYDLQTAVLARLENPSQVDATHLYVLVDCQQPPEQLATYWNELLGAGVDVLQLRDKQATDQQLLMAARLLTECCRESGAISIINDRPDIAALSDADGVHLGQDEMGIADARQIVGCGRIIGISTHSPRQYAAAVSSGADYVGCGPTFASNTKSFDTFPGLAFLQDIADRAKASSDNPVPAFAIGGIHRDNLDQVLQTGIRRIAVSQAVHAAAKPAAEAMWLKSRLHS
jgi:thiamine-phosphate pyrophosphorylase